MGGRFFFFSLFFLSISFLLPFCGLAGGSLVPLCSPNGGLGCYLSPPPPPPPPLCPPPPPPPPPPSPPAFENEKLRQAFYVIQRFKKKITSDPLNITRTWVGCNVCAYTGFSCDKEPVSKQRTVSRIDFNNYYFAGPQLTLVGFLDKLPDVTFFHANSNNVTGSIPENISKLPYFFELDTSNNKFTGCFPTQVLEAKQLVFLDIRFNSYSGSVPSKLFTLDLDVMFINNNHFSNSLPDNFGSTPARYLTFANNKFTGPIPSSIGKASRTLTEVLFLNNKFDGCLPYEIGYLANATLFDASKNKIRGPIPESFACLEKIQLLNLANNQLFDPVPENLCKLPEIGNLSLSNNFITQVGPECRKLIKRKILDVSNNCIRDLPNQKSNRECAKFFTQQKSCPNPKSFNWLPCKTHWYLNPESGKSNTIPSAAHAPAATSRQPYTYSALNRH